MKFDQELRNAEHLVEKKRESMKWMKEIPFIDFPENFLVKPTPNFGGSTVRFRIKDKNNPESPELSVYLDCYEELGLYWGDSGKANPYWEVYPHFGDTFRCGINETDELIEGIQQGLDNPEYQEEEEND